MGRARHRRRRWDFEVGVVKGIRNSKCGNCPAVAAPTLVGVETRSRALSRALFMVGF